MFYHKCIDYASVLFPHIWQDSTETKAYHFLKFRKLSNLQKNTLLIFFRKVLGVVSKDFKLSGLLMLEIY